MADTADLRCPSSVKEGGLIKIGTYDRCTFKVVDENGNVEDSDNLGRPYCEYRDDAALTPSKDWRDTATVQERRQKRVYITINATTGGQYGIHRAGANSLTAHLNGNAQNPFVTYNVKAGETGTIELRFYGRGNYRKGNNEDGVISILPPGSSNVNDAFASCTITVQDDDNTAYAGKTYHPYGGTWQEKPHCYEPGCVSSMLN